MTVRKQITLLLHISSKKNPHKCLPNFVLANLMCLKIKAAKKDCNEKCSPELKRKSKNKFYDSMILEVENRLKSHILALLDKLLSLIVLKKLKINL